MALTKCKECGYEISKKAKNCPNCGAPANRTSCLTWLVLILIIVFV
ncbi:MAG: zinc-ribbon domain-containing protein, partial [Oscillospiraceae bacterium]